jgi:hypothetical protein
MIQWARVVVCLVLVLFLGYWIFATGFEWMVHGDRMAGLYCLGLILLCIPFIWMGIASGYQLIEARRSLRELR